MSVTTEPFDPSRVSEQSPFRQRAWALCACIPAGKVTTYSLIAQALGQPGGSRAVGMAMATNPHNPVVPCHRVVAADGRLNGFARGLDAKQAQLESEGVAVLGEGERRYVDLMSFGIRPDGQPMHSQSEQDSLWSSR